MMLEKREDAEYVFALSDNRTFLHLSKYELQRQLNLGYRVFKLTELTLNEHGIVIPKES